MEPLVERARELDAAMDAKRLVNELQPLMPHWSRTIREIIGLPAVGLARRMGISQPSLSQLERREATGAISIERLQAIAEAMDCELVYGFVPRRGFVELAKGRELQIDYARQAKTKILRA